MATEYQLSYTASEINQKLGAVDNKLDASALSLHNTSGVSHNDIRELISGLSTRLNTVANSDDTTLDQLSEIVAYIKANKGLIDGITTSKVNVADIVDNLTTSVSNKPLSAKQGVALKSLIDTLTTNKLDASSLTSAIEQALATAKASGEFDGKDGTNGKTPVKGTDYWTATDKAEMVEDVISQLPSDEGLPIAMDTAGYIETSSSGSWHTVHTSGGMYSDYVEIVSGYKYVKALVKANTYVFAVLFFNANKGALYNYSVVGDSRTTEYLVEIPSDAKYVIVSHWGGTTNYSAFFSNGDTLKKVTDLEERVTTLEDEMLNTEKTNSDKIFDGVEFSLFKQWGIVGDSLSVGHTADTDGNASSPNYYYSWGQYLARSIGNTCLNFGRSGVSSQAWMTTEKGYPELIKPEKLCQAYILALGANDTSFTLGSISDIDFSNMNNNADTEYGHYAKVINAIRTTAPQAPIFLFTLPHPRNTETAVQNINGMIRTLAADSHFSNVYLVDLDANYNDYFKEGKLGSCIGNTGWHLTALGYLYASIVIEDAISKVMAEHAGDFQNVFEIPYGEEAAETVTTTTETWTFELEDGSTVTKAVVLG